MGFDETRLNIGEELSNVVLLIAEKPSVARDIASFLGGTKRGDGFIQAKGYTVTWAIGHLVTLADAADYDPQLKKWRKDDLPIVPSPFQLKVIESSKRQYQVVSDLLKQAEEVIVATDAGREGQLIYELIAASVGYTGKSKRLWLSSVTETGIREAFAKLRDNSDFKNLYDAGLSRAQADWLVGINATRAMTVHAGTFLSIGRVQTPTLAMIVMRDQEIEQFKPVSYFEVEAMLDHQNGSFKGKWFNENVTRFDLQADAVAMVAKVQGQSGQITKVEQKTSNEQPPQLFDLTSLQRKANQLFGFTADQTLKLAQSLYETHKVLTYPRTDSRYLSDDIVPTLQIRLDAATQTFSAYAPYIPDVIQPTRRVLDASKVTDHHAIIPTEKVLSSRLSAHEQQIYELVTKQTIAALLAAAQWASTSIETRVAGEMFRTSGKVLLKDGWRVVMGKQDEDADARKGDEEEPTPNLPKVARNDFCRVDKSTVLAKQTKPPARFNEASLLAAMEHAGKQVDDIELAQAMKAHGLGTPATRAGIIEKLKRDAYIKVDKRKLISTAKGRALIAAIQVPVLLSPELTGNWEHRLKQMEQGFYSSAEFIGEITEFTTEIVGEVFRTPVAIAAEVGVSGRETIGTCPLCGGSVVETTKSFGCSNWRAKNCKFCIWKKISGHQMTKTQAKQLLVQGQTKLLKFKSAKTGKDFDAMLVLKENGKIEFVFPTTRTTTSSKAK